MNLYRADLLEVYPYSAPVVRVSPTASMVVTPGHPNVDVNDGRITCPTLVNWSGQASLSKLFHEVSLAFSFHSFPLKASLYCSWYSSSRQRLHFDPRCYRRLLRSPTLFLLLISRPLLWIDVCFREFSFCLL